MSELTSLGIGGTTDLLRIKKHEGIPDLLNLLDGTACRTNFSAAARTCSWVTASFRGWC